MERLSSFQLPFNDQATSILYEKLPGEVRDRIFMFALSSYDDPSWLYKRNKPYWRPNCLARPKVVCTLLQTCQRTYNEAWFRPWASTVHMFWLTAFSRRPNIHKVLTPSTFQAALRQVFESHGRVELDEIQVFPQLYMLEPGNKLSEILDLEHLHPRRFTITIRHHDWWFWETDDRLRMAAKWVNECRFPDSVKIITLELESLQRKKDQVDWMADMMRKAWHFRRRDGTVFSAANYDTRSIKWSGSSTWERQRWIRDEGRPDQVDYYVKIVTFTVDKCLPEIKTPAPDLTVPDRFKVIEDSKPFLSATHLGCANVPLGTSASEAKRMVEEYLRSDAYDSDEISPGIFNSDQDFDHGDVDGNSDEDGNLDGDIDNQEAQLFG